MLDEAVESDRRANASRVRARGVRLGLILTLASAIASCTWLVPIDNDLTSGHPDRELDAAQSGDSPTGVILDGAADALLDGPPDIALGDAASPCRAPHLFCADFDDSASADPTSGWSSSKNDAGPMVLDPTVAFSPPHSLRSSVVVDGIAGSAVIQTFSPSPAKSTLHIELDFRLSVPDDYLEVDPFVVDVLPAGPGLIRESFALTRFQQSGTFQAYADLTDGGVSVTDIPLALSPNAWHHMVFEINKAAAGAIVGSLAIDGTPSAPLTLKTTFISVVTLAVGVPYSRDAKGAVAWIDNVVVDEQ